MIVYKLTLTLSDHQSFIFSVVTKTSSSVGFYELIAIQVSQVMGET